MNTETRYSPDEVRRMIRWEMTKNLRGTSLSMRSVNKLIDALEDDVLEMLEKTGLFSQTEIENRIENFRDL